MMGSNLVSILTPTYRHECYIGACIESVLSQTYENWEQLILDDGSDDNTGIIAREYAVKDYRIKYFRQTHRGIGHIGDNYNDLFARAKGEYIAILEGDDFWSRDQLSCLVSIMQNHPDVVLAYGYTEVIDSREIIATKKAWKIPGEDIIRMGESVINNRPVSSITRILLQGMVMMPVSTLIRRSALDKLGGFKTVEDGHAIDYATILELSRVGPFSFVPYTMGYWRRHENQQSSSTMLEQMMRADYHYAISFIERYSSELRLSPADKRNIEDKWRRVQAGAYLRSGRNFLLHHDWQSAREKFMRVLWNKPDRRQRGYAIAGLIFSLFHADIRGFGRIFGGSNR